jgi:uncharacterized DUF497 family protein
MVNRTISVRPAKRKEIEQYEARTLRTGTDS